MKSAKEMREGADGHYRNLPVATLDQLGAAMEKAVDDGFYFVTIADFRDKPVCLDFEITEVLRALGYEVSSYSNKNWKIRCDAKT